MSALTKLISSKNFENFEQLKVFFTAKNVDVKENGDEYMLCFKDTSDFKEKWIRECNGTIFEKETNKLLHYFFEKTYDGILGLNESNLIQNDLFDSKNLQGKIRVSIYLEGSLIKVYPIKSEDNSTGWKIATSRAINASTNFWNSDKSFKELFAEGVTNTFEKSLTEYLNTLDSNYCYNFLLQHPENNKILPVTEPVVHFVNKVNLETLEEHTLDLEFFEINLRENDPLNIIRNLDRSKISDNYIIYVMNEDGVTVKHRIKCLNEEFTSKRELHGNFPDLGLRYLEMYNETLSYEGVSFRDTLIKNFPDEEEKLDEIDRKFLNTANEIFYLYKRIYVQKNRIEIIKKYRRPIYVLHGLFLETKKGLVMQDVLNYMYGLEPWILASLIGFVY